MSANVYKNLVRFYLPATVFVLTTWMNSHSAEKWGTLDVGDWRSNETSINYSGINQKFYPVDQENRFPQWVMEGKDRKKENHSEIVEDNTGTTVSLLAALMRYCLNSSLAFLPNYKLLLLNIMGGLGNKFVDAMDDNGLLQKYKEGKFGRISMGILALFLHFQSAFVFLVLMINENPLPGAYLAGMYSYGWVIRGKAGSVKRPEEMAIVLLVLIPFWSLIGYRFTTFSFQWAFLASLGSSMLCKSLALKVDLSNFRLAIFALAYLYFEGTDFTNAYPILGDIIGYQGMKLLFSQFFQNLIYELGMQICGVCWFIGYLLLTYPCRVVAKPHLHIALHSYNILWEVLYTLYGFSKREYGKTFPFFLWVVGEISLTFGIMAGIGAPFTMELLKTIFIFSLFIGASLYIYKRMFQGKLSDYVAFAKYTSYPMVIIQIHYYMNQEQFFVKEFAFQYYLSLFLFLLGDICASCRSMARAEVSNIPVLNMWRLLIVGVIVDSVAVMWWLIIKI